MISPKKTEENSEKIRGNIENSSKAQRKLEKTPLFQNPRMRKKKSFCAYYHRFFLEGEKTWLFSDFRFNISILKI